MKFRSTMLIALLIMGSVVTSSATLDSIGVDGGKRDKEKPELEFSLKDHVGRDGFKTLVSLTYREEKTRYKKYEVRVILDCVPEAGAKSSIGKRPHLCRLWIDGRSYGGNAYSKDGAVKALRLAARLMLNERCSSIRLTGISQEDMAVCSSAGFNVEASPPSGCNAVLS